MNFDWDLENLVLVLDENEPAELSTEDLLWYVAACDVSRGLV